MVNFESVKSFRKSGMGPAWKAQKTWIPNHPVPITSIFAGVIMIPRFSSRR
jgi:hypothetical protein